MMSLESLTLSYKKLIMTHFFNQEKIGLKAWYFFITKYVVKEKNKLYSIERGTILKNYIYTSPLKV